MSRSYAEALAERILYGGLAYRPGNDVRRTTVTEPMSGLRGGASSPKDEEIDPEALAEKILSGGGGISAAKLAERILSGG